VNVEHAGRSEGTPVGPEPEEVVVELDDIVVDFEVVEDCEVEELDELLLVTPTS
jgi:sulfur carrier protein ThiS